MKFRVAKKDFIIFIIFCIFLLYLCAIAVLNFSSFASEGTFSGLNPLPAFTGDYLFLTLFMFFISLVIIFTSVSSYVFNKEKGKGIGLKIGEKNESGYARWSTEKEIKTDTNVVKISMLIMGNIIT